MANEKPSDNSSGKNRLNESPSPQDLSQGRIVVIGSINMDLVVRATAMPRPGETVAGHSFSTIPGGKGGNQALAAALSGAGVSLIGRVGNDDFAQRLLMVLKHHGVDVAPVTVTEAVSTGTAMIIVDDNGENSICVAGGANLQVSVEDIDEHADLIRKADLVLMQMEIPQKTVVHALHLAHQHNVPVLINPSPTPDPIDPAILQADILIPNEHEAAQLSREPVTDVHSAKLAGAALVAGGAGTVVITLGRRGAAAITSQQRLHVPPFTVSVVDTTGAGDAFCGAFAAAWVRDRDLAQATRFAVAAGALACSRFGAQPSMPRRDAIEKMLKRSC
jgi:ribokinase